MYSKSCFIRKNNPELRGKLEELGYRKSSEVTCDSLATSWVNGCYVSIPSAYFDYDSPHITWNCGGRYDCGKNVELFLSIAALRDDTDYMQWFVSNDGKEPIHWFKCHTDNHEDEFKGLAKMHGACDYHKATFEELVEFCKRFEL